LFIGEAVGDVEFAQGDGEDFAHAAIEVDAEDFHVSAAVGLAGAAGDALLAVEIGFDGAVVAGLDG